MPTPLGDEFWRNENDLLWGVVGKTMATLFMEGARIGEEALPANLQVLINWDVFDLRAINALRNLKTEWWDKINVTTRTNAFAQIEAWLAAGERIDKLEERFITGRIFSPERAESIAITEVTRVIQAGNSEIWGSTGFINQCVIRTANDDKVCELCSSMDGLHVGIEDTDALPPFHTHCLPGESIITASPLISAVSKRPYQGILVTLHTSRGNKITCTPNHPILGAIGWKKADAFRKGDQIICHGRLGRNAIGADNQIAIPSSIEEIFQRFSLDPSSSRRSVPLTSHDFHGDAIEGTIATMYSNGLLNDWILSSSTKKVYQSRFVPRLAFSGSLAGSGTPETFGHGNFSSLRGNMGFTNLIKSFFGSHLRPFKRFGFRLISDMDTGINKDFSNYLPADMISFGKHILGNSIDIFFDNIIAISKEYFSGHVYNLQTELGAYASGGIITHNCRCWDTPVVDERALSDMIDKILAGR